LTRPPVWRSSLAHDLLISGRRVAHHPSVRLKQVRNVARKRESMVIRIDSFEIDAARGVLRNGGGPVRLRNQSLLVLTALARRAGEAVTFDELRQVVWGSHTFVDFEQGLRSCVKEIRAVLGDDAVDPLYIKTIPRVGYRFVGNVSMLEAEEGATVSLPRRRNELPDYAAREEPRGVLA
jgi:DNA-binding winged helix-turn-helix (wHTH) protein